MAESKTWKTLFFIALGIILIAGGILVARAIQAADPQVVEIPITLIVRAPGSFTVTVTPKNPETGDVEAEVTKGTPVVFTITTAAIGGYDGKIHFEFSGGTPLEGQYAFSANDVTPGGTFTLTIQTGNLTSNTAYVCSLTASPN